MVVGGGDMGGLLRLGLHLPDFSAHMMPHSFPPYTFR